MSESLHESIPGLLTHRRATEEEAHQHYAFTKTIALEHEKLRRQGVKGLALADHWSFRLRHLQTYYSPELDCLLWRPTDDELFQSFCNVKSIPADARTHVRTGWDGAWTVSRMPKYDQALCNEMQVARNNLPLRERRARLDAYRAKCGQIAHISSAHPGSRNDN